MTTKQQDIIDICPDLAAWPVVQVGTPEEMAKVRRIEAAAPDLLAVAILVTESGLIPEWSGLGKAARAAIAKAKGK